MDFKKELVKELGLGAISEETMLDDYVKACEIIAIRYHESEIKKLHIQRVNCNCKITYDQRSDLERATGICRTCGNEYSNYC